MCRTRPKEVIPDSAAEIITEDDSNSPESVYDEEQMDAEDLKLKKIASGVEYPDSIYTGSWERVLFAAIVLLFIQVSSA